MIKELVDGQMNVSTITLHQPGKTQEELLDLKPSVAENRNRKTRQNFLQNVNINKFILLCE